MTRPEDFYTDAEAQRLQHIAEDLADLKRIHEALVAERKRLRRRAQKRCLNQRETAEIRRRRSAERAAMAESRNEHRGCV